MNSFDRARWECNLIASANGSISKVEGKNCVKLFVRRVRELTIIRALESSNLEQKHIKKMVDEHPSYSTVIINGDKFDTYSILLGKFS